MEYLSRSIVCSDCDKVAAEFTLSVNDKLCYLCEKCTRVMIVAHLGYGEELSTDTLITLYNIAKG